VITTIAVDSEGRLYFAERHSHSIGRRPPDRCVIGLPPMPKLLENVHPEGVPGETVTRKPKNPEIFYAELRATSKNRISGPRNSLSR